MRRSIIAVVALLIGAALPAIAAPVAAEEIRITGRKVDFCVDGGGAHAWFLIQRGSLNGYGSLGSTIGASPNGGIAYSDASDIYRITGGRFGKKLKGYSMDAVFGSKGSEGKGFAAVHRGKKAKAAILAEYEIADQGGCYDNARPAPAR